MMIILRNIVATGILIVTCSACASWEGDYLPGCIAYEGDRIELMNGEFTWDKFSDQVILDDEGNRVDQFPGYPIHGSYREEDGTLFLTSSSGNDIGKLHLIKNDGRNYLLTPAQFKSWIENHTLDDCTLTIED